MQENRLLFTVTHYSIFRLSFDRSTQRLLIGNDIPRNDFLQSNLKYLQVELIKQTVKLKYLWIFLQGTRTLTSAMSVHCSNSELSG